MLPINRPPTSLGMIVASRMEPLPVAEKLDLYSRLLQVLQLTGPEVDEFLRGDRTVKILPEPVFSLLAHVFKTTPEFWRNIHQNYMAWLAKNSGH